ncbi:hypothetical protein C8J57DRAFT_89866 [Mycena rebaudengoi]|nr:hypothetical protein C8J57DRAFT_89866 [Mycena rebaudengoi]
MPLLFSNFPVMHPLCADRRARLFLVTLLFSSIGYYSGSYLGSNRLSATVAVPPVSVAVPTPTHVVKEPAVRHPPLLRGGPTEAFQDNLRPDVQYIISWPGSGFTNDVILYVCLDYFPNLQHFIAYWQTNLIYLALITERIPVIPFFPPSHIADGDYSYGPTINFGEVFDVPRLQREIGIPILEFHQVKDPRSESLDNLGCWTIWPSVQTVNKGPHFTIAPTRLKLDISYTTAPSWIKLLDGEDGDPHASFWSLAALSFPEMRAQSLTEPALSPINKVALPPDDHLLCFDNLYWLSAHSIYEMEHDFGPAWRFVGKHLHFTPKIQQLSHSYLRRAFGVSEPDSIPPYISIHVRHGDFKDWCEAPVDDCFAPLSVIARRVEEVREDLLSRKGISVDHVVVTSDERDSAWWDEVDRRGWVRLDHSQTAELLGKWYPILIDAAIQAAGDGFVGTDRSTVSVLAAKRVASHGGITRTVRWGRPGADDH